MVARLTPDQKVASSILVRPSLKPAARLAQSVERKTLNLVVVGSSPTVGIQRISFSSHIFFQFFFVRGQCTHAMFFCAR